MKICSTCKQLKPLTDFGKDRRSKDGFRSQCKQCEKKYERNRDPEKKRENSKKYRETHKDKEKTRLQNWKENNPEKYKAYHTSTKIKKRCKNPKVDSNISLLALFARDGGICKICGLPCDYTDYELDGKYFIAGNLYPSIDHVKPLSKGGSHTWDNIQLVHKRCNSIKSNK